MAYQIIQETSLKRMLFCRGYKRLKYSTKMNIKVGAAYPLTDKEREKCIKGTKDKDEKPSATQAAPKVLSLDSSRSLLRVN